jgi:addiction module RelE/StbE family toxin
MRLVWTELAVNDLAAARAYIAQDNPSAAEHQVARVLAAIAGLLRFPEIGRPGRRAGTRELVINRTPYIAAYRLRGDAIEILRVMHSRQRWPDTLAR